MSERKQFEKHESFELYLPEGEVKGVVSIPHAGLNIPPEMASFLISDEWAVNQDVDWRVDELLNFDTLNSLGVAIMKATVHRAAVDINRSEERTILCWKSNTQGVLLVTDEPDKSQREVFIEKFHRTYFDALAKLVTDCSLVTRKVVPVIDFHSMPSTPTAYHLKINPNQSMTRPSICISDLAGNSCIPEYVEFLEKEFSLRGLDSKINDPYAGGHVTQFMSKFNTNVVQIEMNRNIYMDETLRELRPDVFPIIKGHVMEVLERLFKLYAS